MRMHQNSLWLCLLAAIGFITIFYICLFGNRLYNYYQLNEFITPDKIVWSSKKIGDEAFVPQAEYLFVFKGREYRNNSVLTNEKYRNQQALDRDLLKYRDRAWYVWYDSSNPFVSVLEKKFPLKEGVSVIVLTVLFIYFLGLGIYVGNHVDKTLS